MQIRQTHPQGEGDKRLKKPSAAACYKQTQNKNNKYKYKIIFN